MAQQNIILLYDNYADLASLTGGSYLPSLPLENLKSRDQSLVARTRGVQPSQTRMSINLGGPRTLKALCIGPTNLSAAHTYRITAGDYDSGIVAGAARAPWNSLPWEDPNFWPGVLPWEDEERGMWLIHIFDQPVTAQSFNLEFDDQGNPDGYLDFGRLFMGRHWQPSLNYTYSSNGLAFRDHTNRVSTLSGGEIARRRLNPRIFQFGFDYLPEAELYGPAYDFQRIVGGDGEVFVIPDPDDVSFRHKRSFLATAARMDPLTQSIFLRGGTGFELKEII